MTPQISYPPYRAHSSHQLSIEAAQSLLSTYLTESESSPHLHPDALLSTAGVQFSTHGGPMGGLVLHNLRRVEAGLRGERLAPDPEPESDDRVLDGLIEESGAKLQGKSWKRKLNDVEEGWQDLEEFQREQGRVEVGEIGDRSNFVEDGSAESPVLATGSAGKVDKEARKKAKKEREQEKKRKRAEEKQRKAAA